MNKTIDMKTESNTFTKRIGQTNVVLENCSTIEHLLIRNNGERNSHILIHFFHHLVNIFFFYT